VTFAHSPAACAVPRKASKYNANIGNMIVFWMGGAGVMGVASLQILERPVPLRKTRN
jgi:hypothetical protein